MFPVSSNSPKIKQFFGNYFFVLLLTAVRRKNNIKNLIKHRSPGNGFLIIDLVSSAMLNELIKKVRGKYVAFFKKFAFYISLFAFASPSHLSWLQTGFRHVYGMIVQHRLLTN